ncbi:NAD(P)/FAD-dependent oxidoreductase [Rhodovibrionaceae bacterium A322]
MERTEFAIIGGGMIGSATAFGLARQGRQVLVLDEGDRDLRAARGNFGLVWVQGKGAGQPHYAAWTRQSADLWAKLAEELLERTGIDVEHERPGGLLPCLSEEELAEEVQLLETINREANGLSPFEVLKGKALKEAEPAINPDIPGATYSPLDGQCNPLFLLRAFHAAFQALGGRYLPFQRVHDIQPQSPDSDAEGFIIRTGDSTVFCDRVILSAGFGNKPLGEFLGLHQPVFPQRGQILVSEKVAPLLRHTGIYARQTRAGGIMMGDTKEKTQFDDGTAVRKQAEVAQRAVALYPCLSQVQLVRSWGALRVLTPDGLPIYEQSSRHPGAFGLTSHSGVTLAAVHALVLPDWLQGGQPPLPNFQAFESQRFKEAG